MIVIDASALAEVVARTDRAAIVEANVEGQDLVAPDLIGAEVLSVIRYWLLRSEIDLERAERSVVNLAAAPVRRLTTEGLTAATWQLHRNLTPYDATYVALARRLDCPLLTLDRRLAGAPGLGIEVLSPAPAADRCAAAGESP